MIECSAVGTTCRTRINEELEIHHEANIHRIHNFVIDILGPNFDFFKNYFIFLNSKKIENKVYNLWYA